jgi:hypothetical protein
VGSIFQYQVNSTGMLSLATAAELTFDFDPVNASAFGTNLYALSDPGGPAIIPPSGLADYSIDSQGFLTAGAPLVNAPGIADGMTFVAMQ